MKRFLYIVLAVVMIMAMSAPVCALNDQPKFDREYYLYARAEWVYGEPYGEEPYSTIELEIGRDKRYQDDFVLYLQMTKFDGSIYMIQSYFDIIPSADFTFPQKLDSGIALNLQTQGTQHWYSYELDADYNPFNEQSWEEPASYDLDLVWTRDNHVRQFVNNHFALNWGTDQTDLIDLVYKSKREHVTGSVNGTINLSELSGGTGTYGIEIEKIPVVYVDSSSSAGALPRILAMKDEMLKFNDVTDFSDISARWAVPFENDPDNGTSVSLSIGMHNKRTRTWTLNFSEDILNEDNEAVGWRTFVAEIPDAAFAFPKNSPATVMMDAHVCGTVYEYYNDVMDPTVTENVRHEIKVVWLLMTTQTSKAIFKNSDDFIKSMDIQRMAYYDGTASLEMDDEVYGSGMAWGMLWLNHSIGWYEMP